MKKFFKKIISLGINKNITNTEIKRIKLTNGTALILGVGTLSIISLALIFEYIFTKDVKISLTPAIYSLLPLVLSFGCIYLNKIGKHLISRIILFSIFCVYMAILALVYGKAVRIDQYFLVIMIMPFALFQRGKQIIVTVTIAIFIYFALNVSYYFFPPFVAMPNDYTIIFYMLHTIMTIVLILAIITYLSRQNANNEKALSKEINKHIETTNELHKANADKDKFFSIIAHDLKGPIGNIANILGIINIKEIDPELLRAIQSAANNTYELTLDLLTWARAQKGHLDIEPTNYNMCQNCQNVISSLQFSAEKKNIKLSIQDENNELFVFADVPSINTVLRNLVSNAIKFTTEGGTITLSASLENDNVKVTVQDSGIGMEQAKVSQLFNIGSKISSPGTMNETGTGLGLILCKEFVELNGGEIGVVSEINKGSTFWFTLPRGTEIDLDHISEIIKEKALKTLIVEDNYLNLQNTITEITKVNINYDIASDGKEAIEKGTTKKYDFILMDIDLPYLNGIEANKAIRKKHPKTIIIALSSLYKSEILQRDSSVNFDDYLKKPLNVENLLYSLEKLTIDK